jgi:hypothetical protein
MRVFIHPNCRILKLWTNPVERRKVIVECENILGQQETLREGMENELELALMRARQIKDELRAKRKDPAEDTPLSVVDDDDDEDEDDEDDDDEDNEDEDDEDHKDEDDEEDDEEVEDDEVQSKSPLMKRKERTSRLLSAGSKRVERAAKRAPPAPPAEPSDQVCTPTAVRGLLEKPAPAPAPVAPAPSLASPASPPTSPAASTQQPSSWSADDVGAWLAGIGEAYSSYSAAFIKNGIDGEELLSEEFGLEELEEFGVCRVHQKRIMKEIKKLK